MRHPPSKVGIAVINFPCGKCGALLEAEASSVGRSLICPQCHTSQNVPLPDFMPRAFCRQCQADLMLTSDQAGLLVKCPKCGIANEAPSPPGAKGAGCAGISFVLLAALMGGLGVLAHFSG